jgi:dTDP-4-amino-4,6-dideoxygalactose transaminase
MPYRSDSDWPAGRREFLKSAGTLAAGLYMASADPLLRAQEPAAAPKKETLALNGGPKAVKKRVHRGPRWGDVEQKQLNAMLRQDSLFYWQGPQTKQFIASFQEVCPTKYVQTCSSGTAAIHIAVAACGIAPGDEVITSPITDIGTVIGVIYQQSVPVFADLGPCTYNLDVADVESRITPKTKAIIAVHLTGNPCDLDALKALADRRHLILIEDCAQAWGAKYRGRPIGTVGHIACFSLQNSKHVTCGDGGVVASSDERFGPLLQKYGDKGGDRIKGGGFQAFSTNYRMSKPQAAVAAAQLTRLEGIASARARLGNLLSERIVGIPGIRPHEVHPQDRAVYWFYFMRFDPKAFRCDRAEFVKALAAEGVAAGAGYIGVPLYGEPVFRQHGFFAGHWPVKEMGLTTMDFSRHKCPEVEAILKTGIRMEIHEGMTEDYILDAAAAIKKVAQYYAV